MEFAGGRILARDCILQDVTTVLGLYYTYKQMEIMTEINYEGCFGNLLTGE